MKKFVSALLTVLLLFALLPIAALADAPETWAVYMYICGSDLESNSGYASNDLDEFFGDTLPENVTFVIQTGGADTWHNDYIASDVLERWIFRNKEGRNLFTRLDRLPNAPMSSPETFEDFLTFSRENFPADHTMVLVWDHGGGTLGGACKDVNYPELGTMPVSGMAKACKNVFGIDPENPPVDIIAFDCCLMATVDVGAAFAGCARYMLASEEVIPGTGWDYTALINAFAHDPNITPETLGVSVCNDYLAWYQNNKKSTSILTMSFVDLNKIDPVVIACENLGLVLLASLYYDNTVYQDFAINTMQAENFGGNSRSQGFTGLVDLFDFAAKYANDGIEQAMDVCQAVEDCVICNISGPFRKYSHGLSFYFPYQGDSERLEKLSTEGAVLAFDALYAVATGRTLNEQEKDFITKYTQLDPENPPVIPSFQTVDTSRQELYRNKDNRTYVDFGPEVGTAAVQAMVNLFFISDNGAVYYLGSDDEIHCDFENAVFTDNFGGKWLTVGDWLASAELDYDGDDYHIYSIPIEYNGDACWMQRGYNFETGLWEDLGVRPANAEPGNARSFFLQEGEPFRLKQYIRDDETGTYKAYVIADLTYDPDMFRYKELPAGHYAMEFRIDDVFRNLLFSDRWYFRLEDGMIYYE